MDSLRKGPALLAVIAAFLSTPIFAYNVDVETFQQYRGPRGSMFGFSVAEYQERGSSWVIVGAPEAQTSQPGVERGGSVFKCETSGHGICHGIPFDTRGNNNGSGGTVQIDQKSNQWFGATVRSSGGIILACAPRYVWFSSSRTRMDPVGTCFVAKKTSSDRDFVFDEFSPCRTINWGYHRQGYCQAGLGADVSEDGQRLFIGAPGSWYWQGQLYSIDTKLPPGIAERFSVYGTGQVFSQNLTNRPEFYSTEEGPASEDDTYLGYSVAVGDITGTGKTGVVAGMPRGAGLYGKVILYTMNLTNIRDITGSQLGAYFGYSVAVVDVDGDGLVDIIVGAPLHSDWEDDKGRYETGRVYIIYQKVREMEKKYKYFHVRNGKNSKSRFGLSVSGLGDINKDKFEDFAVGAPYDGPDGRGIVYIYHGSTTGAREEPSQIIPAEAVSNYLTTFGFSLSGGMDMDQNEYPDIVVGAYESDAAVYLRSRPVITMDAKLTFPPSSDPISLDQKECKLQDNISVACTTLNMCLEYSGIGVDKTLDFDVQYVLDSKKSKEPRMFFINEEGRNIINQTLKLKKGTLFCRTMQVYMKPNLRDKLSPIEAELRYSLKKESPAATARRRTQRSLSPVLDENAPSTQRVSISIQKNCGIDNICIPDLKMNIKPSVTRYLLGSGQRLEFDVFIHNEGEDAFESTFKMKMPDGINYVNIERIDESDILIQCSAPSRVNNNTLRCDIGNPLPKSKLVNFKVLLQPFYRQGMKPRYEFHMNANSTNPEAESSKHDNSLIFTIPIWVETDLIIEGSSNPPELYYNSSLYGEKTLTHESDIGPQVLHFYNIRNKGPSDILEAVAYVLWPTYTVAGDHLLYLAEQPELSGPIKCEPMEHVNEMSLIVDHKKKTFLDFLKFKNEDSTQTVEENSLQEVVSREESSSSRKTYTSSWSSFSSSSSEEQREGRRTRRQIIDDSQSEKNNDHLCGPTNCSKYQCTIGPLSKDQDAWIVFRSRVDVRTLKKFGAMEVRVSSKLTAKVARLPHIGPPDYLIIPKSREVYTTFIPTDAERLSEKIVPWWVVVLSACAGTVILLLLIFLLWKCGFFKRNRPTDTSEKEPLNSNGHFQPGDEAL